MADRQLVMVSTNESESDLCSLLAAEPRSCFHEGDPPLKLCSGFPTPLAKPRGGFHEGDLLGKPRSGIHDRPSEFPSGFHALLSKPHGDFHEGDTLAKVLLAITHGRCYAIQSNQGERSGSGGRAGEERNGGGGDGNQGIGGGGQREGFGNERRGSRGRSHGGGNGDDEDNRRRGWVGYIVDEGRPMDPRPDRMAEVLLLLNAEIIGTLESLDIVGLSARARILRLFSLVFNSGALVCLSASIGQRRTNPRLARILSCIGSVATFLGFFFMVSMSFSASFIP